MSERRQDSVAMRSELYVTAVTLLIAIIGVAITADETAPVRYVVWAFLLALLIVYVTKVLLVRR